MAAEPPPDLAALVDELAELELREREVSDYRRKLQERLDRYPNPGIVAQEREASVERRELHRRIDELRLRLRPHVPGIKPPGPDRPEEPTGPRLGA
jgi:hypothetical protein